MKMATLYRTNSGPITVNPENGQFSCEELQTYVNGYFEIVHVCNDRFLVCNEEGFLNNLPLNKFIDNRFSIPARGDCLIIQATELQ
jgi:hypothetical protein